MERDERITDWNQLTLRDLFYAYRKAKADCYSERSIHVAEAFVGYESNLHARLEQMLARLKGGDARGLLSESLGSPRLVAKKLTKKPNSDPHGHAFFSDPSNAFKFLLSTNKVVPEFRLIGDFPVEMHILSALWINKVGHLFDAKLDRSAYGARLRRYRPAPGSSPGTLGKYHLDAIDSFQPYFGPYKNWRADGFKAMNDELKNDRAIVAVSLDLKSYYHNIDPAFIKSEGFQESLGLDLNGWEKGFTEDFSDAMSDWAALAGKLLRAKIGAQGGDQSEVTGGVPIGLAAARLMANVLLREFDRLFQQNVAPVYYGRYVDDIFVVLRDPKNIVEPRELMDYISERLKVLSKGEKGIRSIQLGDGYQAGSKLEFQEEKHKVFFLSGHGGADFLHSIEQEIASVSSERRLMPNLGALDQTAAARVLTAAGNVSDEADSLRRADGLSVRRLGWSIQLRSVETLARDLRPEDWEEQRHQFYEFAKNHIIRPDRILDHVDYLPRLLSLAVALQDWGEAANLVRRSLESLDRLLEIETAHPGTRARINGHEVGEKLRDLIYELSLGVKADCADAVLRAWRWRHGQPVPANDDARALCDLLNLPREDSSLHERATKLREHDWGKVAYKDHVRTFTEAYRDVEPGEDSLFAVYDDRENLKDFLKKSVLREKHRAATNRLRGYSGLADRPESMLPFVFPTRPYSAQEIALFIPECITGQPDEDASKLWARYVRAVRGVWVWPSLLKESGPEAEEGVLESAANTADQVKSSSPWYRLGRSAMDPKVRLAVSSLYTGDESWRMAAGGTPDLSPERYERLGEIVKQAVSVKPRPTHLLLPELSLPERWIDSISSRLRDAGISLIAGLDYYKANKGRIYSDAVLVLMDDRLGYPSTVQIRQKKSKPAPHEEEELATKFGYLWDEDEDEKPVYEHRGFCFGLVVCSELQNIAHRHRFQGQVDALIVLAWNQDLEIFSALVESAALDVHACIALANNRQYGDSRVRIPARQAFRRDLCRIRGGQNDYLVVVEFDPTHLREFQSRAKNWVREDDAFKPVPEGFSIHPRRRKLPR